MSGRKKRVYIEKEHVETVLEACTFRVAEGAFDDFLNKLRKNDLERINGRVCQAERTSLAEKAPGTTILVEKFRRQSYCRGNQKVYKILRTTQSS